MPAATASDTATQTVPMLIAGRWRPARADRGGSVYNPSTGRVIARVPFAGGDEVDEAVRAAANALPKWAETPAVDRARLLFRYRDLLERHADELARTITREHGKTLVEARASVQR